MRWHIGPPMSPTPMYPILPTSPDDGSSVAGALPESLTSMPAHCSIRRIRPIEGSSPWPWLTAKVRKLRTALAIHMGTPSASPVWVHSVRSLTSSRARMPRKSRGSTNTGNLSWVELLLPLLTLMTSSMTFGSSPDFTPITSASAADSELAADRKLLPTLTVWPIPAPAPT